MNVLLFISVRFLDILDVLLVTIFISYFYTLVRNTVALRILFGLLSVLIIWRIAIAVRMEIIADLIGTFIGIGAIAFVIIFQPELRNFLLRIGSNQIVFDIRADGWLKIGKPQSGYTLSISKILMAVEEMSKTKMGGIIVIDNGSNLDEISATGTSINADISIELITTIFFKNNALHDGAMIISKDKIRAAGCILPNSNRTDIPKYFGLRHRAVLGLSEISNAFVILISEETGKLMTVCHNKYDQNLSILEVKERILNLT